MWHDQALVTVGNALTFANDSSAPYATVWYQNTSANNDEFTNGFVIRAGTYTLKVMGQISSGNGKLDCYIDNVNLGTTLDWYNASLTEGQVKTISSVVISDGYHTFKGKVNGKNASSSGYNIALAKYWLSPSSF